MSNRHMSGKLRHIVPKHLVHQAHATVERHFNAICHGNAGAFLAAVLESEEGEKGHASGFLARRVQSDDTALFLGPIVVMGKADHVGLWHPSGQR